MIKKLSVLIALLLALLLALTAFAGAETLDLSEITGFWMNTDNGFASLEIREDGSGALMDLDDDMGVPVQVKEARNKQYDYTICLGGDEFPSDLSFDAEEDALILHLDNDRSARYVRDYWDGMPVARVSPDLSVRYSPEAFELTYGEDGSLRMTCRYREGGRDYINISLVKDATMASLLEGIALQSGQDGLSADYGCWDLTADEAGSVDYIHKEDGIDYDCFFMAVKCGSDCYLVECHSACLGDPETDPDNSLTGLYESTLGSIRRVPAE